MATKARRHRAKLIAKIYLCVLVANKFWHKMHKNNTNGQTGRYLFPAVKYFFVAYRIEKGRGQMNGECSLDIRSACEVR